ncbi:MAG: three-Cys-motif partner protein TcmP [Parvibaculaceae bacterium]|nr:three-Cys-motif partner protein TcmP [Parvibaculaceae bacterium]HBM89441.1 hypothetical protein [Rhodobiaceae bacterium]|tara:strand:+ start:2095 stop:2991 length:897 start_codon:yes stop_codon:yes gene_type:complete
MNDKFGGRWTTQKLKALEEYLRTYTTALNDKFDLVYIDAFAGRGGQPIEDVPLLDKTLDSETPSFAKGSVRRALELTKPFGKYYLIDSDPEACLALSSIANSKSGLSNRVEVINADANEALIDLVQSIDWRGQRGRQSRAVAFLDPYACQLRFETIEMLAATRAIDVWILFPTMAINRMLVKSGVVPEEWRPRLRSVFGVDDWGNAFYRPSRQSEMFGEASQNEKQITPESLEDYYGKRLGEVFAGGVLPSPLRLSNNSGGHLFALFFACSNPNPKANVLAKRLARSAIHKANSQLTG